MFKEKEMIHFYKPILSLLCKYYGFILFKWVSVVFAVELQMKYSIQSKKMKKINLTEEKRRKKNTIHSFADSVLLGLFSLFFLFNGL